MAVPSKPLSQVDLSHLTTTSARIRYLKDLGYRQADIARRLGIRDQHVSNVVRGPRPKSEGAPANGLSEPAPASFGHAPETLPARVSVDAAGRVALPSAWGVRPGSAFIARRFGDSIVLMDVREAARVAREAGDATSALIAERRLEAMREFED